MLQPLLRNVAPLAVAEGVARVLGLVISVLLGRTLGADRFGTYALVLAVAFVLAGVIDAGTSTAYVARIAADRHEAGPYLRAILPLKAALGVAIVPALMLAAYLLQLAPDLVALAGLFVFLEMANESLKVLFRAYEKLRYEAVSIVAQRVTFFVALLVGLVAGVGLRGILALQVAGAAIGFIITWHFVRRFGAVGLQVDGRRWRRLLHNGRAYFLLGLLGLAYVRGDAIVLGLMRPAGDVGLYVAAQNLYLALGVLPAILTKAILPRLAALGDRPDERRALFRRLLLFSLAGGGVVVTGLFVAVPVLVRRLYGEAFVRSVPPLRVLLLAFLVVSMSTVASYAIMALRQEAYVAKIAAWGTLTHVLLSLAFIPSLGITGVAWATLVTELAMFGCFATRAQQLMARHEVNATV